VTAGTGPDGDHTTGSRFGFFMHIEASLPAQWNDTSRLISPDLTVTNNEQCFRFYYHMYGSDVYRLNIYARISKSKRSKKEFLHSFIHLFRWKSWESSMAKRRQSSKEFNRNEFLNRNIFSFRIIDGYSVVYHYVVIFNKLLVNHIN
jgi:hypothetical protein